MYDARVGVPVEMHRISAAPARPPTRGRSDQLLSLPYRVVFGQIVPIRRTRSNRAARALFGQQSHWKAGGRSSFPRSSPFCPGLADDATFGSKSFLRSRLVRSLRGSTRSSTERSVAPADVPGDVTRQDSDQPSTRRANGTEGLTTVIEEDLEDWVDDFEAISLSDVPLGVEGVGQAGSAASSSSGVFGISPSSSTSESESSRRTKQSQPQPQPQPNPRPRTTSKTSRRSNKSARREELRLILDFPLPPTFIPTPPKTRTPPPPSRHPPGVAPVNDDASIFYDHDPFRAEPIHDQDAAAEVASLNIAEEGAPRVDSSASFYTAHSRSSSPAHPPPSSHPSEQQQQPSPQPLREPSYSYSPTGTLSTSRRSIRKASATLKRLGNRTKETLLTSIRTPINELSVRRPRRTRVKHVSLDQLPHSTHHLPRPVLPDFQREAFDIAFPAVETPRISPRASRAPHSNPSVQSFYASLEEFLTSHLHSEPSNRRSRFRSAPTLLLTTDREQLKREESPSAEIEVAPPTPPTPPLPLPRTERPLPPLPDEKYEFVDPSTLTVSSTVSPSSERRYSSIPPSPSWLSRNVRELEIALTAKSDASSVASSRSACGSDTELVSTVHLPKAVKTRTPSASTTSSSTRLHGEVVRLRGRVNIQDATPQRITLRSRTPSSKNLSEATVVLRTRSRSRRNRSGYPSQSRLVISTVPPNPPVRPRSRTSSVTKATITHYRRSLLETKKKSRSRKEDPAKFDASAKVSKVRPESSIRPSHLTITFLLNEDTFIFQFISVSSDKPAHCFSSSTFGDCPRL